MVESDLDVVVSGGSHGGLFAGIALRERGHRVDVFERSTGGLGDRGAGVVAQPTVLEFLDRHDLADAEGVTTTTAVRQYLRRDGSVERERPESMRFTSWDELYRRLRSGFPDDRYHLDSETVGVEPEADGGGAALALDDGTTRRGDVAVAAEGLRSTTRAALFADQEPEYAGYVAWRGTVPETAVPGPVREQVADAFTFFHGDDHLILAYPIPGPEGSVEPGSRRLNWVWYDALPGDLDREAVLTDEAGERRDAGVPPGNLDGDVWARKRADAGRFPDAFARLVERSDDPFVQAIFDLAVPEMTAGRVCLLGDAAFVARPHTAAGTAKAAGDAVSLAEALADAADPDAALAAWEDDRLPQDRRLVRRGRRMGEDYMSE